MELTYELDGRIASRHRLPRPLTLPEKRRVAQANMPHIKPGRERARGLLISRRRSTGNSGQTLAQVAQNRRVITARPSQRHPCSELFASHGYVPTDEECGQKTSSERPEAVTAPMITRVAALDDRPRKPATPRPTPTRTGRTKSA